MALEDDQQESHQYELPELNSLVTENNTFSLKDMISLSDKDKFETALNQLMDKASYITELAEINQQYKNYFNDLAQVHDGDIFIDNLACDHSFCLASFQLLNGSDWDISTLSRQENTPMYNLYISQLDGSLNDRQVLIFSTDKSIDGIDAP